MKCPNDDTTLAMTDRQGIEVDYCPTCRGVWLDRGELDKLIERSSSGEASQAHPSQDFHSSRPSPDDNHGHQNYHRKRKKESFLGELFDF